MRLLHLTFTVEVLSVFPWWQKFVHHQLNTPGNLFLIQKSTLLPFPLTPLMAGGVLGWIPPVQLTVVSKCSKPFKVHLKSWGWQQYLSAAAMDFMPASPSSKAEKFLERTILGHRSCEAALPDQSQTRIILIIWEVMENKLHFFFLKQNPQWSCTSNTIYFPIEPTKQRTKCMVLTAVPGSATETLAVLHFIVFL